MFLLLLYCVWWLEQIFTMSSTEDASTLMAGHVSGGKMFCLLALFLFQTLLVRADDDGGGR